MRGRVMSLYSVVFLGSTPIGAPAVGWLAEVAGPRSGLLAGRPRRGSPRCGALRVAPRRGARAHRAQRVPSGASHPAGVPWRAQS